MDIFFQPWTFFSVAVFSVDLFSEHHTGRLLHLSYRCNKVFTLRKFTVGLNHVIMTSTAHDQVSFQLILFSQCFRLALTLARLCTDGCSTASLQHQRLRHTLPRYSVVNPMFVPQLLHQRPASSQTRDSGLDCWVAMQSHGGMKLFAFHKVQRLQVGKFFYKHPTWHYFGILNTPKIAKKSVPF